MKTIPHALLLVLALCLPPSLADEINVGVDLQEYPELVLVPGFPVYYAPQVRANYFFYDGDFWMYEDDHWYKSPWYDGPWERVDPEEVPDVILQIPVRYYEQPPVYFFSWWNDDPPHWGEHWGSEWERHRRGWDKRDHDRHRRPAPLPEYQRQYPGDRYPRQIERQHELRHGTRPLPAPRSFARAASPNTAVTKCARGAIPAARTGSGGPSATHYPDRQTVASGHGGQSQRAAAGKRKRAKHSCAAIANRSGANPGRAPRARESGP